jgi:tRNA A37 methylthiotransferase MiaB
MKLNNQSKIYIDRISNDCILSDNKFVRIYNFLVVNNYIFLEDYIKSDFILLDLCWVNSSFLIETYKKIDLYIKEEKTIIVFWCISDVIKERYKDKLIYIDSKNYYEVEKVFEYKIWLIKSNYYFFDKKINILNTDNSFKNYNISLEDFDKSYFLEISNWCQLRCTYCNIKKIKWDTKSITISEILDEIKYALSNWKNKIYLLSDDCWSYWIDLWINFLTLVDSIVDLSDNIQLYITNIYPAYLLKYYSWIKKYIYSWKIPFILLPIQHTSDRILSLMNRWYNIEKILEMLKDIKTNSKTELCNHIIFDYQEETLEEFVWTFKLLEFYDRTFYFKYSDINKIYTDKKISYSLREKITLLKKLQKKYNIDIGL